MEYVSYDCAHRASILRSKIRDWGPRLAFVDLTDGRALGKQSGIVSPRELYLEAVYGVVHVGIDARWG